MIAFFEKLLVYYLWFDVVKYLGALILFVWAFARDPRARNTIHHFNYPTSTDDSIRLLSYNIGFGAGVDNLKGAVHARDTIKENLSNICETVRQTDANVLCLQEIDLHSRRSWYLNEIKYIARTLQFPYVAVGVTWNRTWVPYPTTWRVWEHYGKVFAGQAIFSKFPLTDQHIIRYKKPKERSFLYRLFYLDRISQFVRLTLPSGQQVHVSNSHLEAFVTRARHEQASLLSDYVRSHYDEKALILAGDFNAIRQVPDAPTVFDDEPHLDYGNDSSIQLLDDIAFLNSSVDEPTFPSPAVNRQLDYVYYSPAHLDCVGSRVVTEAGTTSDHLPIFTEFYLR